MQIVERSFRATAPGMVLAMNRLLEHAFATQDGQEKTARRRKRAPMTAQEMACATMVRVFALKDSPEIVALSALRMGERLSVERTV